MRRNHDDLETIDALKLKSLGIRCAGHPGQVVIEPEIVLKCDGRNGLVFLLDCNAFFRLHGLVQAVGPAAAHHGAARKFIDDDDLAVFDNIVDVFLEHHVCAQCSVKVMDQPDICGVVQTLVFFQKPGARHQVLYILMAVFCNVNLLRLLVL